MGRFFELISLLGATDSLASAGSWRQIVKQQYWKGPQRPAASRFSTAPPRGRDVRIKSAKSVNQRGAPQGGVAVGKRRRLTVDGTIMRSASRVCGR